MGVLEGIQAIITAARREGMDDQQTAVLLATGYVESGWNARAIGDGGNSFGLFQANVNGAAANVPNPKVFLTPSVAASEAAARFKAAGVKSGAGAVATQRPLESLRPSYTREVDRIASAILAGTFGPLNRATGATAKAKPKWSPTRDEVRAIAKRHGLRHTSGDRITKSTASGNVSDHWSGQTTSWADDYAGSMDAMIAFQREMRARGDLKQVIGPLDGPAADHMDHVHVAGNSSAGGASIGGSTSIDQGTAGGDAGMVRTSLLGDAGSWVFKAVVVLVGLALAAGLVFAGVTKLTGSEQLAGTTVGTIVRGAK